MYLNVWLDLRNVVGENLLYFTLAKWAMCMDSKGPKGAKMVEKCKKGGRKRLSQSFLWIFISSTLMLVPGQERINLHHLWSNKEKLFLTVVFITPRVYSYTKRHALSRSSPGALTPLNLFNSNRKCAWLKVDLHVLIFIIMYLHLYQLTASDVLP